jgi:DNA-binding transcriptional ArsR family regulator
MDIETVRAEMSNATPTTSKIGPVVPAATEPAGPETAACCADTTAAAELKLPPEPRMDLPAPEVGRAVATAALLADRTRAGILRMLVDGPHCVCELAAALGERQNNVSMHLARLREAGLVRAVRHETDARWMFYERDEERCAAAAAWLAELLR